MVYLFIGTNSFAKQDRLKQLAEKHQADVTHVRADDQLPSIDEMSEATLFGGSRLIVLHGGTSRLERETQLPRLARSPHIIVVWEDKMDKRKTATSEWLKDKQLTLEQFEPPAPESIPSWIVKRAGELGATIDLKTAQHMQARLMMEPQPGKFGAPSIDVWRLENELRKVCAYVDNQTITAEAVDVVITDYGLVESWDITNALAERNQVKAFVALEQFFNAVDTTDDKAKTIQLNAALAEQFRTILLVQDMIARRVPDSAILESTGWKSGRLFIIKKLAGKFQSKQVINTLEKLYQLDKELKSSSTPGQVVMSLIAAQV